MKTIAPLPLARLDANHSHVEAFQALAHLSRLQVFFFLVRVGKEMSVGEIQEAVEIPGPLLVLLSLLQTEFVISRSRFAPVAVPQNRRG